MTTLILIRSSKAAVRQPGTGILPVGITAQKNNSTRLICLKQAEGFYPTAWARKSVRNWFPSGCTEQGRLWICHLCGKIPGIKLFTTLRIMELFMLERTSLSLAVSLALLSPELNRVPKCQVFKHLQRLGLNHCPGHSVPGLKSHFRSRNFS